MPATLKPRPQLSYMCHTRSTAGKLQTLHGRYSYVDKTIDSLYNARARKALQKYPPNQNHTKHQTPNAKHQTPNAKRQTPNATPPPPYTKRQTPNTKRQTPNAKHQTPNAKTPTPNTQHQTPSTKHQTLPTSLDHLCALSL